MLENAGVRGRDSAPDAGETGNMPSCLSISQFGGELKIRAYLYLKTYVVPDTGLSTPHICSYFLSNPLIGLRCL